MISLWSHQFNPKPPLRTHPPDITQKGQIPPRDNRCVQKPSPREYNIFYTLRILQIKNIKLQKEKNNPKLQNLLIKQ